MLQQALFASRLFAICSLQGMNLAMHVLGDFAKGWVASSAEVHIRLLWPFETLC